MTANALDLLIVNPHHDEFFYIPMGSFAIARFLADHGYAARITNLAAVAGEPPKERLARAIATYRPRHIGIIFHWKETMHGAIAAANATRRLSPESRIWMGGISASVYAEQILESAPYIDGVVRGDAEIPLLRLVDGQAAGSIPNIFSRQDACIIKPRQQWVSDSRFLDSLVFGDLSLMDDLPAYLALLDTRLGIPLAGSRGCWHDCGYCGGSRSAFRAHAGRRAVAIRQPSRVMDDLELALSHGARTFLISQPASRCEQILREIHRRRAGRVDFTLNLEPWEIPSRRMLQLYADLICEDTKTTPQLLLSVHGAESPIARVQERNAIVETTRAMIALSDRVQATIFDGYFCRWQQDRAAVDDALKFVLRTRSEFAGKHVSVALMAYSTDPESPWSRDRNAFRSSLELASISRGLLTTETTADNLLLMRPAGLRPSDAGLFMATLDVNERLYHIAPLLWSMLLSLYGEDGLVDILQSIGGLLYTFRDGYAYPTIPNRTFDLMVLSAVENKLLQAPMEDETGKRFIAEFSSLTRAAAQARYLSGRSTGASVSNELLVFNKQLVHESLFSFDRLLSTWRCTMRVERHDLQPEPGETGAFFYTLLPSISDAFTNDEIDKLMRFDGISTTETIVSDLALELGVPAAAVRSRVEELVAVGTLQPL